MATHEDTRSFAGAQDDSATIGWIGIGRMGYAMAERLAKAGADVTVWNRTRAKAEPLAAHGAKIAASLVELSACDIVFVMVAAAMSCSTVSGATAGLCSPRRRASTTSASSPASTAHRR